MMSSMNMAFMSPCPVASATTRRPLSISTPLCIKPCFKSSTTVTRASLSTNLAVIAAILPFSLFPSPSLSPSPGTTNHHEIYQSKTMTSTRNNYAPLAIIRPPSSLASATSVTSSSKQLKQQNVPTIRQLISFYTSEFLMWHPGAKILSLFAFTLLVIYLGSFLYKFADPSKQEAESPFWHSVRAVANPLEDNWEKNSLRATSIALASFGMVVFAILVGMVTETVETTVKNADGYNIDIILSNHLLVVGWSQHTATLLKNVSEKSVVVLAPLSESQHIKDASIKLNNGTRKIHYRPGIPSDLNDLKKVGASRASKILLVATDDGGNDDVMTGALALSRNLEGFRGDVIVQVKGEKEGGIVKDLLRRGECGKEVESVNAGDLFGRFMAQAVRQPGLADVVERMMGSAGSECFNVVNAGDVAPQLIGRSISEIGPVSIDKFIICGFVDGDDKVYIENGKSMTATIGNQKVSSDTKLLVLGKINGEDSDTSTISSATVTMMQNAMENNEQYMNKKRENILVLGWRNHMNAMVHELDSMLPKQSTVTIVSPQCDINNIPSTTRIQIKTVAIPNCGTYEAIQSTLKTKYDHIIVTSTSPSNDSSTLSKLIYINDTITSSPNEEKPIITAEFTDNSIATMAQQQGFANTMLPQTLGARIAAQAVRNGVLNKVWNELLSQRGKEVYLRRVEQYGINFKGDAEKGKMISFESVVDEVSKKGDIVVGYLPRFSGGVVKINPQGGSRYAPRVWHPHDVLVVLSNEP